MNVSDTCNAAADLIEVRGWTFGPRGWVGNSLFENDGSAGLCIEGALMAALGLTFDEDRVEFMRRPVYRAVLRAVAVIHAAQDESAETRAVEAVSA